MANEATLGSGKIVPNLEGHERSFQPAKVSSMCFYEALIKRNNNEITEEEYLQALLAHCDGTRHGKNRLCNNDELPKPGFFRSGFADNLHGIDKFTGTIARWIENDVCKKGTRTVDNTTTLFQVLRAYRSNDAGAFNDGLVEMEQAYEALGDPKSMSVPLCQRLAYLIVPEGPEKIDILKLILEKCNVDMGIDFEIAYHNARKNESNQELLRVISASGFKSQAPPGMAPQEALEWYVEGILID